MAKVASDMESGHAKKLMEHTTYEITNRVYGRKAKKVKLVNSIL
jgi:hypothetical protein